MSLLLQICAENLSTNAIREARSRLAGRPIGPYQKLRVLKSWVSQDVNPPRFRVRPLPFSRSSFYHLARLVLGGLTVGRTQAMYQYRSSLSAFGESWFGKRACLHYFLKHDNLVLDSEWHWMFDCHIFSELRLKNPYLFDFFKAIQKIRGYAVIDDLGKLLTAI